MSYQVLARKWRPKSFREMAGQGHVLKALINALDHDRLHHAYLFTGTRGVGKTTIARILAKCLNCETGVSSEPCGQCQSCVAISEGRFVDLIEVDAASRTKVEDTRELLDNVQYTPSQGRYKVYLIDEVHMLSGSSFNALLKTLEEPPPHVKFLLATTDPQKIPATILSRCLQFSLKNLSPEKVVEYLKTVLDKEMVQYDEGALWLLGRAADGSMRDALSLSDQGIAFGNGKLLEDDVRQMLGTINHDAVYRIVDALNSRNALQLIEIVKEVSDLGVDPSAVVDELLGAFHRLAMAQVVPEGLDNSLGDRQRVLELASRLPGEDVQFYYQMALAGRRDFGLSPDPRAALEMLLLRMLAFMPAGVSQAPQQALPKEATAAKEAALPAKKSAADRPPAPAEPALEIADPSPPPSAPDPQPDEGATAAFAAGPSPQAEQVKVVEAAVAAAPTPPVQAALDWAAMNAVTWRERFDEFALPGMLGSIAAHCQIDNKGEDELEFCLDQGNAALLNPRHVERLGEVLSAHFQRPLRVNIRVGEVSEETPAGYRQRILAQRLANARQAILDDPTVQQLVSEFEAVLEEGSVTICDIQGSVGQ